MVAASYLGTLLFWTWSFAQQEEVRKEFSPQMQNFLLSIAGSTRSNRIGLEAAVNSKINQSKAVTFHGYAFAPVLVTMLLLLYAGHWRRRQSKKAGATWVSIVSKLHANDWGLEEVSERILTVVPSRLLHRIQPEDQRRERPVGYVLQRPVLVQLADYAAQHGEGVSEEVLEQNSLRSDAFQIRICVLIGICACRRIHQWSRNKRMRTAQPKSTAR